MPHKCAPSCVYRNHSGYAGICNAKMACPLGERERKGGRGMERVRGPVVMMGNREAEGLGGEA